MNVDRPIQTLDEDKLGRQRFANIVASAVCSVSPNGGGFVMAIEGPWGSGKTSLFNLIEKAIREKDEQAVVVRFEPWLISGVESLAELFLIQIAAAIGRLPASAQVSQTVKKVVGFAKLLAPLKLMPGVEPWGTVVESVLNAVGAGADEVSKLSELDLHQRKKAVSEALSQLNRRIVVIIDDIDRMAPDEVSDVFRLVKAVADFPQVTHLLAYDPQLVEKVLKLQGIPGGLGFVEKVVQVSYPLPRIAPGQLRQLLVADIEELIAGQGYQLEPFEEQRLEEAVFSGVASALRQPRDLVRLINRLRIAATATRGEVNLGDVVAYEVLGLRFPTIAEAIRRSPHRFLLERVAVDDVLPADYATLANEQREGHPEVLPSWLSELLDPLCEDARVALSLIDFLFPGVSREWAAPPVDAEAQRRICVQRPLLKMLSAGHVPGIPEVADVERFLQGNVARDVVLANFISSGQLELWLEVARQHLVGREVRDPERLAVVVADSVIGRELRESRELLETVHAFVCSLLAHYDDMQKRVEIVSALVHQARSLSVAERVVLELVREHGRWAVQPEAAPEHERLLQSWAEVEALRDLWLARVRALGGRPDALFNEPAFLSVLFRWGQLSGDYQEPRNVFGLMLRSRENVKKVLDYMNAVNASVGGLEDLIPEESREQLVRWLRNDFNTYVKAKELADILQPGDNDAG